MSNATWPLASFAIETSILEFAYIINRLTDNNAGVKFISDERTEDDPQRRQPDISRAREVLGWEPVVDLADGLSCTIDFFAARLKPKNGKNGFNPK